MKKLLFMLLFVTAATMTVACGGDDESTIRHRIPTQPQSQTPHRPR